MLKKVRVEDNADTDMFPGSFDPGNFPSKEFCIFSLTNPDIPKL